MATPVVVDGVKMIVQFYANHGALMQVEEHTGVPVNDLRNFLDTGKISATHRKLIIANMAHNKKDKPDAK